MPTTSQLQELDKLNRIIKQKSLDYKINKEYGQETLKEFYKPILDVKSKEQELIEKQHKETIEEIGKIPNLIEEIKKQQLIAPLMNSLKNYPRIIAVLQGKSDGSDLTEIEQHILKQLDGIDVKILSMIIENINTEVPSTSEKIEPVEDAPPQYSKIPPNLKSINLGEWLINNDIPNKESAELLFKKGRDDRTAEEIKGGIADYVTFLVENGTIPSFNYKPWTTIKAADPEFYNELRKITGKKLKTKAGTGISIDDLIKKLEILYAEKLAGNNNVISEASEILDKLRHNNIIDIDMLKEISKRFK